MNRPSERAALPVALVALKGALARDDNLTIAACHTARDTPHALPVARPALGPRRLAIATDLALGAGARRRARGRRRTTGRRYRGRRGCAGCGLSVGRDLSAGRSGSTRACGSAIGQ